MEWFPRRPPSTSGIDRRSALKKVAAAGAIAWVAPSIISNTAHAVDFLPGGCTEKCAPQVELDQVLGIGTLLFLECDPDSPPGQQAVRVRVTAFEAAGGSSAACPCGGTPTIEAGDGGPIVGQEFDAIYRPGNGLLTFPVPITISCTDRSGNKISAICLSQAVSRVTGNCNSNEGRTLPVQFLGVGCEENRFCTPA